MTKPMAFGLTIVGALVAVAFSRIFPTAPAVTLTFTGYAENGTKAVFAITNHTRHYAAINSPGVEYPVATGWTNYYDCEELSIPAHAPMLNAGRDWSVVRALPLDQRTWRAHLYYRLYVGDGAFSGPRRRWENLLGRVGLSAFGKERVIRIEEQTR